MSGGSSGANPESSKGPEKNGHSNLQMIASGFAIGSMGKTVVSPLILIKTRAQREGITIREVLQSWKSQERGQFRTLWKGNGVSLLKTGGSQAIALPLYHFLLEHKPHNSSWTDPFGYHHTIPYVPLISACS